MSAFSSNIAVKDVIQDKPDIFKFINEIFSKQYIGIVIFDFCESKKNKTYFNLLYKRRSGAIRISVNEDLAMTIKYQLFFVYVFSYNRIHRESSVQSVYTSSVLLFNFPKSLCRFDSGTSGIF